MYRAATVINNNYNSINPIQFGTESCKCSHSFGPAIRGYWLIHFIESGKGIFRIGEQTYKLNKGDMFVIPPFVETYYEADKNDPWVYTWVGFTSGGKLPLKLDNIIHCPDAVRIFNQMKKAFENNNDNSAFLCSKIWELFSLLKSYKNPPPDYIEKAINIMHSEYSNGITIEEIAERLAINRSYFFSLFKKEVGISPSKYLLSYRMKIAASLLTEYKKSVSVAAFSVGYSDIYNFSKMFKRYFGVSPKKYVLENSKKDG